MFDPLFIEVVVPVLYQTLAQKVRFVDKQHEFLFTLTYVCDVFLKVTCVEELWVSSIYNLHQNVRFFDYSPQLSPNLDVLFKRCNREVDCVLLLAGDIATPLKERQVFFLGDFLGSHVFIPSRSAWDF